VIGDVANVYGVRLAGRESRQAEPPATALGDVVLELTEAVLGLDVPRVALFGHCSGALLAFEVAVALRGSARTCEVSHLIVASQLPPDLAASRATDTGHDLARFLSEDLRDDPELLEMLLPILAADMRLVSGYATPADAWLDVPLTVMYGGRDTLLSAAQVDGWRRHTSGATVIREIAQADHLFGGTTWLTLATTIRAVLTEACGHHG
jgi:surfactin synthase thioesterase subunit